MEKKVFLKRIYIITILAMIFIIFLAGMQRIAFADDKIHWKSNSKDEEIQIPEGVTGDGGKWESATYDSSNYDTNSVDMNQKSMSDEEEYGAIAAGILGVLALSAAKKSTSESVPELAEGNGIWVPETDRDAVIQMINKAASKQYYIDETVLLRK